nr:dTDP-4-dehydrorhamnose reductase [Sphingomonas sp. IC-56]
MVTGGAGQLGSALSRLRWPDGWCADPVTRDLLDLEDAAGVRARFAEGRWDAVINAAAYTAVDRAEDEPAKAWAVNALGPAILAECCREAGIPIVQVSTDYVFPGTKLGAWAVTDPVAPLGVYGASKLGGELAVGTSGARHAVVRTSWVFSAQGSNFVKTMLRLAADRDTVRVVADQTGGPTAAADLADALARIVVRLWQDPAAPSGTYHFANAGCTNWADFAREIFAQSAARGGSEAHVEPIATCDFPTRATRPANSLLDTSRTSAEFSIFPRPWTEALGEVMDELLGQPEAAGA